MRIRCQSKEVDLFLPFMPLVFSLLSSVCSAQGDLRVVNSYTQKDGLSNSAIYGLYEDSHGFLWIATKEGLNRFDGYRFKTYYHSKHSAKNLPHNTVYNILEYQPGMLLIATANGLGVYNTTLGTFENERILHAPLAAGNGANVTSLYQDEQGNIWVNQNGELDILDQHLQYQYCFTDLAWALDLKGSLIKYESWQTDHQGRIWLPTDTSGIQIIDFAHKTIINRDYNPEHLPFMDFKLIRALLLDKEKNLVYIAPWGAGIYTYDMANGTMLHQDFGQPLREESSVNAIVRLENGHLLCSSNGIFFDVNPITLDYHVIEFPLRSDALFDNETIMPITILKSTTGRYWIGANEGLFQLEQDHHQSELSLASITGSSECIDVMVTKHGILYSLYENGHLIEVDSNRNRYHAYAIPQKADDFQIQLCEINDRQLWIATSRGILWFDMVSKKFTKPTSSIAALNPYIINTLYRDRDGDIWIGTRQPFGLYCYTQDNRLHKIENEFLTQMAKTGAYSRISSIVQDNDGYLWMRSAVGGGILKFDKKNISWNRYPSDETKVSLLANKGIYSLYPDDAGNLWMSTTAGDGLIRYAYATGDIEQFNREDGLASDYIFQISHYQDHLWLTSQTGYTKFNIHDHTMIAEDWTEVSSGFDMTIDTLRHEMVLGTTGKLVFISTNDDKSSPPGPVPVIDAVSINNKPQYIDPHQTKLKLAYDQKNITIDFTAAWFRQVNKLRFAYFLSGADKEWQYPGTTRTAQYAALSPGTYNFRIKASDPEGHWGNEMDAFTFTIIPPFWLRPWFLVFVCAGAIAATFAIGRKRMKTIRKESDLKQKVAETEMMALRAQMNPHFIFNSINSIDALIQNDDKYQATLYLNKFAKLIRNILDSSKQNTVTLEKDMETLRLYIDLEQLRSENAFTADIHIDPAILQKDIRVPPLIIQPYVENAIQHGIRNRDDNKGQLHIQLQLSSDGLEYVIEDNGVGRDATLHRNRNGKTSYGMQMSHDRIMHFNREENASVKITDLHGNGNPSGTKVEIRLKTTYIA